MDADNLLHGDGVEPEGILVAQVVFRGERQFGDVVKRADVFGLEALFVEFPPVEGDFLVAGLDGVDQTFCLESAHLLAGHAFDGRIVYHGNRVLISIAALMTDTNINSI